MCLFLFLFLVLEKKFHFQTLAENWKKKVPFPNSRRNPKTQPPREHVQWPIISTLQWNIRQQQKKKKCVCFLFLFLFLFWFRIGKKKFHFQTLTENWKKKVPFPNSRHNPKTQPARERSVANNIYTAIKHSTTNKNKKKWVFFVFVLV